MNIYHVFIDDNEGGFMIALAIYSPGQVKTLGESFPTISKIETWDGEAVYTRRTVH
jgi:hypothetical protein